LKRILITLERTKTNPMKKAILFFAFLTVISIYNNAQSHSRALLIIDIQNFYFPGGKMALVEPEKAAANAALLLERFRKEKQPVIHIRHNSEPGGEINDMVKPLASEKIISKDAVNCFVKPDLPEYLKSIKTDTLVICGMQTHMCVEAATRAASDMGFKCILIHDACATRDLKFGDKTIKAEDVHYSTLATLKNYALIESTKDYLKK
jgi:nicotinamidase-related amidase